jgi:hypothetical protein
VGGFTWWARVEWIQGQRPMWREHDAKLASVWRRESEEAPRDSTASSVSTDTVIVLPEPSESVAQSA